MDTLKKIQRLEHERHELYKKAGRNEIGAKQRARISEIAGELYTLWDQHRREVAVERWGARSVTRTQRSEPAA